MRPRLVEKYHQEIVPALMEEFEGNVTKACEAADMERESLHRALKRHGVSPESFRSTSTEAGS